MATTYSFEAQSQAFNYTEFLDSLLGVLRTGWGKTTNATKNPKRAVIGAEGALI